MAVGNEWSKHDRNYSFDSNPVAGRISLSSDFQIFTTSSNYYVMINTSTVNIVDGMPLTLVKRYAENTLLLNPGVSAESTNTVQAFLNDRLVELPDLNYYGGDPYILLGDGTYLTFDNGIKIKGI